MTVSTWDPRTSSSLGTPSTFLGSKFGRRLFLLFAGCALLPVLGLALISYLSVNRELVEQAEARLADTSKSVAMGIWERLAILDSELQIMAIQLETSARATEIATRSVLGEDLSSRLSGIVVGNDAQPRAVWGLEFQPPRLSEEDIQHLASGRPLLNIAQTTGGDWAILLGREAASEGVEKSRIWGNIKAEYLWWGSTRENTLPAGDELAILDATRSRLLYNTLSADEFLSEEAISNAGQGSHRAIAWQAGSNRFQGHYRLVNLRPAFYYPGLTLLVGEPKDLVIQPLETFKWGFLAVLLATMLTVALLSVRQIRSSLIPLEKLREGTRTVAGGDFGVRVAVESDDEFAELAGSFNSMTSSLDRQFSTLKSLNELQQTVLTALDVDRMVATVLQEFERIFPCQQVSVCVMQPGCGGSGWIYHNRDSVKQFDREEPIVLQPSEMDALARNRHHLELDLEQERPSFMPRAQDSTPNSIIAFPAFVKDDLVAVVAAAGTDLSELTDREFESARQLTDQVAIGLSNIRLVNALDDLNWGTLSALARAIDVRSSWTMGHTERVTSLAQQLGRTLGLSDTRLTDLHRGGLLHDIGKIGVASEILDKPGALTAEEMECVRQHVRLGARIIEPIPALENAVPIVLQHHEWFNGEGYPAGLVGDEICFEARILSVADCYDALRSERPYRGALSQEAVLAYIQQGSGVQFDPQVVEAFLQIMADDHGGRLAVEEIPELSLPIAAS